MSNLSRIIRVCACLDIPIQDVHLYAGYKEIMFTLPDSVIESLRNQEDGFLDEKYNAFCEKYGIYYVAESECWVA